MDDSEICDEGAPLSVEVLKMMAGCEQCHVEVNANTFALMSPNKLIKLEVDMPVSAERFADMVDTLKRQALSVM